MIETAMEIAIAQIADIPTGEGRTFNLGGTRVAVFHTRAGEVYATQADCPHKAGPLADGLVGGTTLICPLHAWKFDLRSGEALMGSCGIKTYPARIDSENRILLTIPASI